MATLQEVEADIKDIAGKITAFKASGAAKTDPATLKKHVVRESPMLFLLLPVLLCCTRICSNRLLHRV